MAVVRHMRRPGDLVFRVPQPVPVSVRLEGEVNYRTGNMVLREGETQLVHRARHVGRQRLLEQLQAVTPALENGNPGRLVADLHDEIVHEVTPEQLRSMGVDPTPFMPAGATEADIINVSIHSPTGRTPSLDLNVQQMPMEASTRRLRARWSVETVEDLRAFHNLDAEQELVSALSNEIAREVDSEIVRDMTAANPPPGVTPVRESAFLEAGYVYAPYIPLQVTPTINTEDFTRFTMPMVRRVFPSLIANDIVSVQPMTAPLGSIFFGPDQTQPVVECPAPKKKREFVPIAVHSRTMDLDY